MESTLRQIARALAGMLGIAAMLAATSGTARASCDRAGAAAKPADAITLTTKPAQPATGENDFTVVVRSANCSPVVGATVTIELVMPAMPGMPEMRNKVTLATDADPKAAAAGTYTGRGQIYMTGRWNVTITAMLKGEAVATRTLTITAR